MKKIKKYLIATAVIATMTVSGYHIDLNNKLTEISIATLANKTTLANADDCTDKVERYGDLIVVTVCKRKTNWIGALVRISCNKDADTSCSFNNTNNK